MGRPRNPRRRRSWLLALLAVMGAASVGSPVSGAEPVPGSAGIDTSLEATDSQVERSGRGPFADMRFTINQTEDLVNQAVSVTWEGGIGTTRGSSRFDGHYLQIMQCWGDDDGTNAANPGPPPEQCVQGATDAVVGGRHTGIFPAGGYALERIISRNDFPNFDPDDGFVDPRSKEVWRPFRAVDGVVINAHIDRAFNPSIVGGNYWLNPYFDSTTTNEIGGARTGANGEGAALFEVTTGVESSGLGCGMKVEPVPGGEPKAPRCWLVIVPRGDPAQENDGTPFPGTSGVFTSPLSPNVWQHRIAVPLDFVPVESTCDITADQRRISGNELPTPAVSSWQPKLCGTPGLPPYVYGTVGDPAARQQLLSGVDGAPGMVVVSRPIDPSIVTPDNPVVYGPLTLSGTVIGFNIERLPHPESGPEEELLRSVLVAELNLTPRLVAKLLTQSYRLQTALSGQPSPYEWAEKNPRDVGVDPDFLQFNPEFELLLNNGKNLGGFVMPARNSDAARQVWEWVFADAEAKAWLDGEPDPWGMRVNPIYATTADANVNGIAFGEPVPDQFPKSDPYCYQASKVGPGAAVTPPLLCSTDWLPYAQSLRDAARVTRAADDGARTFLDTTALTAERAYRPDGPQILGTRNILSLTDSASAHQYGVQMARLSWAGDDDPDRVFVAPDEAGLTAGVQAMAPKAESTVLEPDPTAADAGAYPLTTLTYAAVAPLSLDAAARSDYAAFLDHAAGPGQVIGREVGQLPPGYAPLPAVLQEQTREAARKVRELQAPADPSTTPTTSAPSAASESLGDGSFAATALPTSAGASSTPQIAADFGAVPAIDTPAAPTRESNLMTPVLALAKNRFVLPGLAAVALAAGLLALEITKRPRRVAGVTPGSEPQEPLS